jgi:hypothetical protein
MKQQEQRVVDVRQALEKLEQAIKDLGR